MAMKTKSVYRCTECGAESLRWSGQCGTCQEWNTLVEEMAAPKVATGKGASAARRRAGSSAYGEGGRSSRRLG